MPDEPARGGRRVPQAHQARGHPPPDAVHRPDHARRSTPAPIAAQLEALHAPIAPPDRPLPPRGEVARRAPRRPGCGRALRARISARPIRTGCAASPRPPSRSGSAELPPKRYRELFQRDQRDRPGPREAPSMSTPDPVTIGLVATSDRASQGVYRDEGIPALESWLAGALAEPRRASSAASSPTTAPTIEATLVELVDRRRLPSRRDHRRHRARAARRDAGGHARGRRPGNARLRRADAAHRASSSCPPRSSRARSR